MRNHTVHQVLSTAGLATALYFGSLVSSQAAIAISWSGGSGTPLSLTLTEPVEFLMTANPNNYQLYFVIQGAGDVFGSSGMLYTNALWSGIGLTVSGGASAGGGDYIVYWSSGDSYGTVSPNDVQLMAYRWANTGNIMTLNAGTLTGLDNFAGPAPANGAYNMFLADNWGNLVGEVVPEPSAALLSGLGMLTLLRRRR